MKAPKAFSLIEVMSAAAILAVGLVATFTAFNSGAALFEHQRHTTNGIHLSEAKLEELLIRLASDTELVVGTPFGPEWYDKEGIASPPGCPTGIAAVPESTASCRYRVTWQSSVLPDVPSIRVVTVTTAWNERGLKKEVTFSTQRN